MGSSTYILECLRKICALLKVGTLLKEKFSCNPSDHPKLDLSPLLCEKQHFLYQQLFCTAEWAVQIGRFDIRFALIYLNCLLAAPREGHLSRLVKILVVFKASL